MNRLPPIVCGRLVWRLPWADSTAAQITSALLASTTERSRARFEAALAIDPSLLLWTVWQAHAIDGQSIATLRDGAAWLENRQLAVADWSEADFEPETHSADPEGLRVRAAQLAAKSVLTAEMARKQLADAPHIDSGTADRATCAALLAHAQQWLNLALDGPSERVGANHRLPERFSFPWQTDDRSSGARPAWADVVLSAKRSADKSIASLPPDGHLAMDTAPPLEGVPPPARGVYRHWLEVDERAVEQLTVLLGKLRELHRWRADFERRLETEKLDAMKELAYGASHEINNPLANIALRAQTLFREEQDPQRRRKLSAIHRQAMRAHEMISDLMLFARPPELDLQPVDLVELIDQLIAELTDEAGQRGTTILHDRDPTPVVVLGDPVQLAVALRALCDNSLEAIGRDGQIWLSAENVTTGQAANLARLTIRDNGPGIAESIRPHLFDPFFSGREAGRGLGFGLSKCWRIVTEHGGHIDVRSEPDDGATFVIELRDKVESGEKESREPNDEG